MQTFSLSQMRRFVTAMTALIDAQTPKIDLLTVAPPSNPDPAFSAFTLADFDGYAPIALASPTTAYNQADGTAEQDYGDLSWILTATPSVGNIILGYVVSVVISSVQVPVMWEPLPSIPMNAAGNAVVLSLPLCFFTPGSVTVIG